MVTSAGPIPNNPAIDPATTETTQDGTSQAGPVTAGVILLLQERYQALTRNIGQSSTQLPPVDLIEECLRAGGYPFEDLEDQTGEKMDNVKSCNERFVELDAYSALKYLDDRFRADVARAQAQLFSAGARDRDTVIDSARVLHKNVKRDAAER